MKINILDIKKEIENIPGSIFKKKINKIKILKTNKKNINIYFKIEKKEFLFRINIKGINNNSYKKSKKEFKIMKLIEKYNLSENRVIYFSKKGTFFPYSYIIIKYIPGKEIKINNKNILLIARKIAKINNKKISFLDKLFLDKQNYTKLINEFKKKEEYIKNINLELYNIYLEIKKNIEKEKPPGIDKDNYLIHGDLNYKNIIENKNKIYFIDWEYLKIGNPLLDIAKLSHSKNFEKFEYQFFKEYTLKFNKIKNIYNKYKYYRNLQVYLWLITSTEYFYKNITGNEIFKLDNKKNNLDIIRNYTYLYKKKYILIKPDIFKNKIN